MKHTKEAMRRQRPTWALLLALVVLMTIVGGARDAGKGYVEQHFEQGQK